jgi:hypothetical protein
MRHWQLTPSMAFPSLGQGYAGASVAGPSGYAIRHAPWTANAVNGFPLVGAGRRWGQWLFLLCLPGLPYMVPYMVRTDFGGLVVEIEIFVVIL